MSAISSFIFEIFADDAAGHTNREIATIKKKCFMSVAWHHWRTSVQNDRVFSAVLCVPLRSLRFTSHLRRRERRDTQRTAEKTLPVDYQHEATYTPVDYQQEPAANGEQTGSSARHT